MAVSAFLFLLVMVEPPVKKEFYLFVKVVSYYYTNPLRTVKRMRAETSFILYQGDKYGKCSRKTDANLTKQTLKYSAEYVTIFSP